MSESTDKIKNLNAANLKLIENMKLYKNDIESKENYNYNIGRDKYVLIQNANTITNLEEKIIKIKNDNLKINSGLISLNKDIQNLSLFSLDQLIGLLNKNYYKFSINNNYSTMKYYDIGKKFLDKIIDGKNRI